MMTEETSESCTSVTPSINHPESPVEKNQMNPRVAGTFSLVKSLMYSVCPCSSISSDQPRGGEPY